MIWKPVSASDKETDEIVKRRFGQLHRGPCARPSVLTCALWACQKRNRCQDIQEPRATGREAK